MPRYYKKYYRKRDGVRSGSKATVKKDLQRVKKKVEYIGRPELKVIDTLPAASNPYSSGNGVFTLLNGCSPGDGISSRDGRKIRIKSVEARVYIGGNSSYTQQSLVRMILFWDKYPNGSATTIDKILEMTDTAFAIPYAPIDLDNRKRFVILKDKQFSLTPAPNGTYTTRKLVHFKKIKVDKDTVFNNGTAATVADIMSGALYMYVFSDNSNATYPDTHLVTARVRFTDV